MRKTRRRRGGAMIKSVAELIEDLERNPTEATMRNVFSDLQSSGNPQLERYGRHMEERLGGDPGVNRDELAPLLARQVVRYLREGRFGGRRRRKTTRRRR